MKADTREWVRCAEEDYEVACALMRRRTELPANTIGFHCQQCVEKYLKARLEEAGLTIPKIHSLAVLLNLLVAIEPLWVSFNAAALQLTNFAVKFRYRGHVATRNDARKALADCRAIQKEVRLPAQ